MDDLTTFLLAFWGSVAAIVFVGVGFVAVVRGNWTAVVLGLFMLFSAGGLSYLAATPVP